MGSSHDILLTSWFNKILSCIVFKRIKHVPYRTEQALANVHRVMFWSRSPKMARVALWGQLGPNKQSPVWAQATLTESAQFQRCHHCVDIERMLHVDVILFFTETAFHCWSYDCVAEDLTSAYLQRGLACPRLWATISLLPARGATWNMRQNCQKHGNVSTNYAAKDMIFWLTTAISSKLGNMTT